MEKVELIEYLDYKIRDLQLEKNYYLKKLEYANNYEIGVYDKEIIKCESKIEVLNEIKESMES